MVLVVVQYVFHLIMADILCSHVSSRAVLWCRLALCYTYRTVIN